MAYSIGKTSALQTAIKAGVDIAVAELAAGILTTDVMVRVHEVADELKVELFAQADEDVKSSGGSGGGFNRSGGASQGPVTLDDAKGMVLNFGWAKGLTLADVAQMTVDETKAYTAGAYKRSGIDYLRWMQSNKDPKGAHAAARAKLVVADYDATGAALTKLAG